MTEVPGGRVPAGVYTHGQALQLPQVVVHVDLKFVPGTPRKVAPLQWKRDLRAASYLEVNPWTLKCSRPVPIGHHVS